MGKVVKLTKKSTSYRVYFNRPSNDSPATMDSLDFTQLRNYGIEGFYYFEDVTPNEFTSESLVDQLADTNSIILRMSFVQRLEVLKSRMERVGESYIEFTPDFGLDDE